MKRKGQFGPVVGVFLLILYFFFFSFFIPIIVGMTNNVASADIETQLVYRALPFLLSIFGTLGTMYAFNRVGNVGTGGFTGNLGGGKYGRGSWRTLSLHSAYNSWFNIHIGINVVFAGTFGQ